MPAKVNSVRGRAMKLAQRGGGRYGTDWGLEAPLWRQPLRVCASSGQYLAPPTRPSVLKHSLPVDPVRANSLDFSRPSMPQTPSWGFLPPSDLWNTTPSPLCGPATQRPREPPRPGSPCSRDLISHGLPSPLTPHPSSLTPFNCLPGPPPRRSQTPQARRAPNGVPFPPFTVITGERQLPKQHRHSLWPRHTSGRDGKIIKHKGHEMQAAPGPPESRRTTPSLHPGTAQGHRVETEGQPTASSP